MIVTKMSQNMEKLNWLSKEKKLQNEKKQFIIIIRKYYILENFGSVQGKDKKSFSFALMFEKRNFFFF